MTTGTRIQETVGVWLGALGAPLVGAITALRQSRMFHPKGDVFFGEVEPFSEGVDTEAIGLRLAGPALLRFSTAWWKNEREWPDVLGLAIRFRSSDAERVEPEPGDQDLLLATVRTPITTPLAPLSTDTRDFLNNDYYGVSPFDVEGLGRTYWRVTCPAPTHGEGSRRDRLLQAVARGHVELHLEMRRKMWGASYRPVAKIHVRRLASLDQEALRFNPFQTGRGLEPRSLVHSLRRWTYATGQKVRPHHARA